MALHKGWIALDIDGTITDHTHHVPSPVALYLKQLQKQGWQFIFITGRSYSFASSALHVFDFPFYLAVQNGADILEMPTKHLVSRRYLSGDMIPRLEQTYTRQKEDFIIYVGYERGDFCYYRPKRFSPELLEHLKKIETLSPEPWQAVNTFEFASHEAFPLIKCLGFYEPMHAVNAELQLIPGIAVSLIRDPLEEGIFLNLVTHPQATKGNALERIIAKTGKGGLKIAAGDDRNDISMLEIADIRIVMENAPQSMHSEADIIAKSSTQMGIVAALERAIQMRL